MAAVETLITDHLDLWTAALKRKSTAGRGSSSKVELYGIKKLRELILELAVRGLLVPQDPNEEPASELLKKIAAEKAKLVKAGRIKKEKPQPPIGDEEILFSLPNGWAWIRNASLFGLRKGKVPKDISESGDIPYLDIEALDRGNVRRYTNDISVPRATSGDLLVVCDGSRSGLVLDGKDGAIGSTLSVIETPKFIQGFVKLLFLHGFERLNSAMKGAAIPHLDTAKLLSEVTGLPSLTEQHRIVAKVDELMALCDQLEQQADASRDAHQTLVKTLLSALTSAANHAQFASAWLRIAGHFDTLFTTEESIDQLKQTILQLAVVGKLLPQDPNDEPASELLKKIAAEKGKLVKEGKIKSHLPVEPMGKSEVLPATWVEIVVQDFADIRLGSTPSRTEPRFWNGDIPWVSSGEVADCIIKDTSEKITQEGFKNSSTSMIPARSLLMAIIGQGKTRGQTALLAIDACTNQNVAAFVFNERFASPEYVWTWAKSKYESHRDDGHGGAQPALNGKKVRGFRFPLAPIAEQHRIVAKVDELMALCDQLKSRLSDAQTTQLHLADALIETVLARA